MIIEKDKDNECLKIEVVSLREKLQESNMNSSSKIINQIISFQISTNDKNGIGYKSETTNASTSTNKTEIGYKSENTNASTSTTLEKIGTGKKNTSMHIGSSKQERNQISMVQRRIYGRYQNKFEGYCVFCYNYGHKAVLCNCLLRNRIAWNNYDISRSKYGRRTQNTVSNS